MTRAVRSTRARRRRRFFAAGGDGGASSHALTAAKCLRAAQFSRQRPVSQRPLRSHVSGVPNPASMSELLGGAECVFWHRSADVTGT